MMLCSNRNQLYTAASSRPGSRTDAYVAWYFSKKLWLKYPNSKSS